MEAYCVKCREKREIQDEKAVTMKNGRHAIEGTCAVCGTRLFRMISNKDAEAAETAEAEDDKKTKAKAKTKTKA